MIHDCLIRCHLKLKKKKVALRETERTQWALLACLLSIHFCTCDSDSDSGSDSDPATEKTKPCVPSAGVDERKQHKEEACK